MTDLDLLTAKLRVTEALLTERNKVMDAIPPCPDHGGQCVPHALAWVEMAKAVVATAKEFRLLPEDLEVLGE